MLIVVGSARARPGRRDELVSAARNAAVAVRGDDGCVSYGFFVDIEDEDVVANVEIWRDRAALDAHMTHAHTQEFLQRIADLFDGEPSMAVHEVATPR